MAHEELNKKKVLLDMHQRRITPWHPPQSIYWHNANKLVDGIKKGWKRKLSTHYNSPDVKLYKELQDNIFHFSGAKTFQQTLQMSQALTKGGSIISFEEFEVIAGKIFDDFNETWLETEYDTAIDGARQADLWNEYTKNGAYLLGYHTEGDDTVCDICGGYDGTILPPDDPFWDEAFPPNHFLCHCYTTQEYDEDSETESPPISKEQQPMFKNNVGKTGQIFTKHHDYFQVSKEYKSFAEKNFGLPIPTQIR